jgi:3-isopropylmalate dehydrogenase
MMLRYSFCLGKEADAVDAAVEKVLDSKNLGGLEIRTGDLGGTDSTVEVGNAVAEELRKILSSIR